MLGKPSSERRRLFLCQIRLSIFLFGMSDSQMLNYNILFYDVSGKLKKHLPVIRKPVKKIDEKYAHVFVIICKSIVEPYSC